MTGRPVTSTRAGPWREWQFVLLDQGNTRYCVGLYPDFPIGTFMRSFRQNSILLRHK